MDVQTRQEETTNGFSIHMGPGEVVVPKTQRINAGHLCVIDSVMVKVNWQR